MSQIDLRGICPIVDTPFTEDGDVDYENLRTLANTLAANGCHALALFGYASEFYKLDREERQEMADIVVDRCDDHGIPSVVSVTAQSTEIAVERAQYYENAGADALMVLPPHVRDPPVEGVAAHVREIAEAVSVPIMIQYAPGSTKMTLPVDTLAELYGSVENIDYFKIECDPPGQYIESLHEQTDGEAEIFVGRAGYEMIEGLDRDCVGVMPASAMYDIYLDIYDYYMAGDRDRAVSLHSELVAVLNQLTKVGMQFEKYVLAKRGLANTHHCRAPEQGFDDVSRELMDEYYDRYVEPNISFDEPAPTD